MTSKAYSNKTQIFRQTVRRDIVLIIVFTVILLVFQSLPLFCGTLKRESGIKMTLRRHFCSFLSFINTR